MNIEIKPDGSKSLLTLLRDAGYYPVAACGGNGTCGKCFVETSQGRLLACKTFPKEPLVVYWEGNDAGFVVQTAYLDHNPYLNDNFDEDCDVYGIAIDIGTTTIGFELVNIISAKSLAFHSCLNSQRRFGADVMSRIAYSKDGLSELRDSVVGDILCGCEALCAKGGIELSKISHIAVCGNTAMLHFLLNTSCQGLGVSPYKPEFIELLSLDASVIGLHACKLTVLPGISGFVGADIVCGLLLCDFGRKDKSFLFVDIGTNGEMALWYDGKLLTTATAAGPAFEGGNISCGTGGIDGAICKVSYDNGFVYKTIRDAKPVGICGSGVLDVCACLFANGFIDESGYCENPFEIAPGVSFLPSDIRQVQLAKSAIRSGIDVLFEQSGLWYDDVDTVYLAGGFGMHLDINSAIEIGLLPMAFSDKIIPLGNAALGGCSAFLKHPSAKKWLSEICGTASTINLAEHTFFNERFLDNMGF